MTNATTSIFLLYVHVVTSSVSSLSVTITPNFQLRHINTGVCYVQIKFFISKVLWSSQGPKCPFLPSVGVLHSPDFTFNESTTSVHLSPTPLMMGFVQKYVRTGPYMSLWMPPFFCRTYFLFFVDSNCSFMVDFEFVVIHIVQKERKKK